MTLQGAMRYDHAWSYFPEQTVGPVRFFPTAVTYPRTTGVEGYHDLWPRGGVAYDLFGTGKTSIKVNFGRYLEAAQNGGLFIALNPTGRLSTTTTRMWQDDDRDFVADCVLENGAAQGTQTPAGGVPDGIDFCGANASANFGTQVFDSTLDPGSSRGGACVRATGSGACRCSTKCSLASPSKWDTSAAGSSTRLPPTTARGRPRTTRVFGVTIPTDSRLPGGGGGVLNGLYNVTPEAALRLNDNYQTLSSNIGDWTQVANSLNLNVTARMRNGLVLQGGFNTGTNDNDYCDVRSAIPEWTVVLAQSPTNPWCDTSSGWVTRVTALGSYTIPKVDVQVSGTLRSDPGGQLAANWTAPNSATVGLNRPFAGLGSQTITVNLIEPGTLYGERVNQIDMRFAKILRFGRSRTTVGFDVYNLVNSDAVLTYNQTFSPTTTTWLRPNSVLQPRFVKFSAQIDF